MDRIAFMWLDKESKLVNSVICLILTVSLLLKKDLKRYLYSGVFVTIWQTISETDTTPVFHFLRAYSYVFQGKG